MAESIPITDYLDLDKIYTKKPQNRNLARSKRLPIHVIDTETRDGDIFLIADSDGRYLDKINTDSVLKFISAKKYEYSWNFCYGLFYDAEVILKLFGKKLYEYKKKKRLEFQHGNYTIKYIPKKVLTIQKGKSKKHSISFYDLSQFFQTSLTNAYEDLIGVLPEQYHEMKTIRDQFSKTYYRRNTSKVRQYCIDDCKYSKEIADKWTELFSEAFGFNPKRWVSSGYLAEKVLINHAVNIPLFKQTDYEIQKLALRSYYGGRFEILKRGFIGQVYIYDINSAYPYAITTLPDITDGTWIKNRKSIHHKADLGFFRIIANIPDDTNIPPFPFRTGNKIVFPTGPFETYVTLAELKVCEKSWYKILESYQFIPNNPEYHPFAEFIQKMYQKRLRLKQAQNPLQLPIKVILNAIYGKTGQKVDRINGNLFNPVIFAFITGFARAQLYRFVIENNIEKEIVAFATDSIATTKKLNVNSDRLGEFSLEKKGDDGYFLQNGIYRINKVWKNRGIGRIGKIDIESLETFEDKDGKVFIKYLESKNTRLLSAIIEGRIQDIGKIKPKLKKLNLNADRKRLWFGELKNVKDKTCNESLPLSFNYFIKTEI